MRSLVLVGLIVAVGAAAGCQQKKPEPTTHIYPPESVGGLQPFDDVPPPPEPAPVLSEPVIHPPIPAGPTEIPAEIPTSPGERVHVVVKGDRLWSIARKYYGTANRQLVQKIVDANPGIDPDRIFPGQKIIVPE